MIDFIGDVHGHADELDFKSWVTKKLAHPIQIPVGKYYSSVTKLTVGLK